MEERTYWTGRKSRKTFLHYYLFGTLLAIAALLLLTGFFDSFVSLGVFSSYASYLLGGVGVILVIASEIKRILVKYIITETRIIKEEGIINRHVDYIPYQMVEKISFRNMWYERLLKIGNLEVDTGEDSFWLYSIDNPEKVEGIINKAMGSATRRYYQRQNSVYK